LGIFKKNEEYDQIRYLDEDGQEIIRINSNRGNPYIVPFSDLQNKGDRYYFYETLKLNRGEIYFSPFDLNVEHSEIEIPLKPMIRIGTPVFNSSGQKKGIVILNYLGENLLTNLKVATLTKPGVFSLLNKDGYWLYNDNEESEWGFMYPEKEDINLSLINPEKWEQISSTSYGQTVTNNYLQTSLIINLFQDSHTQSDEYWILDNTITFEEVGLRWSQIFLRIRFICLFILLFDVIIAYILFTVVSQRNKLMIEMESQALYDTLTKLPNRRLLYERAENAISQSRRYKSFSALIFIDLDGFKAVNDTLGHDAGDQLLIIVGERLKGSVRASDTVSRVGGDEFIILISQVTEKKNCAVIAGKILKNLSLEFDLTKGKANIQGSIGIAIYDPQKEESVEELIRKADSAMYEVKKSGKNNYKIYHDESELPG
jgi:diguanylate cyclase (GGDEF)-like protein